jgi:hypothetical protein
MKKDSRNKFGLKGILIQDSTLFSRIFLGKV